MDIDLLNDLEEALALCARLEKLLSRDRDEIPQHLQGPILKEYQKNLQLAEESLGIVKNRLRNLQDQAAVAEFL